MLLTKEEQEKVCNAAEINFVKFEDAVKRNDVDVLNDTLTKVKKLQEKLANEKQKQRQELMKLTAAFIAEFGPKAEKINRAKTQGKFNNKQPSDIEKLKAKIKKYFGEKVECKLLQNDKNPNEQLISDGSQKTSKQAMEVTFHDGTGIVLHVNNGGISVPDELQITEETIPNIVKTVEAMGLKEVNVNKAAFPKENREELYQQLCEGLNAIKGTTVKNFQAAEENQQQEQEGDKAAETPIMSQ